MLTSTQQHFKRSAAAFFLCSLLGFVAPMQSARAERPAYDLGEPVIALVPIIKQHEKALKLDAAQQEQFAQWLKTAPAKRQAAEDKLANTRLQLRAALLDGMGDTPERQALIEDIGKQEAALVAMRAGCVDRMRTLLNPEQFTEVVALYKASLHKTHATQSAAR
ncbi:hypothetical protein [Thiomonas sp.]|jgi:hypothetical protein|uniref:LTXXQ motif family protein n=1 Tax=Thiomonas intermedia (strain K12) TaxID=75379 RepID=D5WZT3_THIK1|nr:hypothetical protein [Thiomonas sp.]